MAQFWGIKCYWFWIPAFYSKIIIKHSRYSSIQQRDFFYKGKVVLIFLIFSHLCCKFMIKRLFFWQKMNILQGIDFYLAVIMTNISIVLGSSYTKNNWKFLFKDNTKLDPNSTNFKLKPEMKNIHPYCNAILKQN